MRSFVLSLTGRDRPGIVAGITGVLLDHAVNVEDSEMAILRGHFAVMLVLSAPAELDEVLLRAALEEARVSLPLETLSLTEVPALEVDAPQPSHAVSVYGADHPGIVHGVTAALAERKVNVVGLSTRIAGERDGAPLYILLLELALPPGLDQQGLGELLDRVAGEQGVDVSVRAIDSDPL